MAEIKTMDTLTQQSWIRALDSNFKSGFYQVRICYKALKSPENS